ncbi:MAG: LPS-assembly protein LptD [Anaerovibrio sp.]|uniref:LPS-assembly protein LptD n=1 Tax=Anaerovibrio sp. TaxID=1872532 RepID=UPI0025E21230|nr:LPS-assembly protein LptD [Anaerovibrio sp.]MCR5176524.1 LPS-assembly protein LptD [Anaerovibrio sp.]
MKKKIKALLCAGIAGTSFMLGGNASAATYHSDTDTNADVLDYIENDRRSQRENALTDEQQKLVQDAFEMRKNLHDPLDPTKNIPIAVEGDDLFYDQRNGDFTAKGNVKITTLDAQRFQSDLTDGNLDVHEIKVPGKAHMLQMTPGQAKIILDGYKTQYNYETKTGKMEDVDGKVGHQYIKGKRIELYPDKIIVYDGYMTKCSAVNPDYKVTASRIEVYPNDKMICHNMKFWLGSIPVYSTKKQTFKLNGKDGSQQLPRVGFNKDDGLWLSKDFSYYLTDKLSLYGFFKYTTKHAFRNHGSIIWDTGLGRFEFMNGYYAGNNHQWLKKSPSFLYTKTIKLKDFPISWGLMYERGSWSQGNIHSMHTYYGITMSHDPIALGGNHMLELSTNYSVTKESANHRDIKGVGYKALVRRDVDDRWAYYALYSYTQANSRNSVFDFDLDSYSRKFAAGFSYRWDKSNRLVVGSAFNASTHDLEDVDLYWFHDMHCYQLIVRYRVKRRTAGVTLQFNPW